MKTYHVSVPEVWYRTCRVEAESVEEAVRTVEESPLCELNEVEFVYSHELDFVHWAIEEVTP